MAKKIGTVKDDESGIEVPIYMDTKTLIFSASFGDFKTDGSDGHKVRAETLAAIKEHASLTWIPVIKARQTTNIHSVTADGEEKSIEDREMMGLQIERFYAARKHDGKWVRVNWWVQSSERLMKATHWYEMKAGETEIRYSAKTGESFGGTAYGRNEGTYILPYDENVYLGLVSLIAQMKKIRQMVTGLLTTEEGIQRLISVGSNIPLLE